MNNNKKCEKIEVKKKNKAEILNGQLREKWHRTLAIPSISWAYANDNIVVFVNNDLYSSHRPCANRSTITFYKEHI